MYASRSRYFSRFFWYGPFGDLRDQMYKAGIPVNHVFEESDQKDE